MKRFQFGLIFVLAVSQNLWSQETVRKNLNGKVMAELYNLEDIDVINMQTEKFKKTQTSGYFSIDAKEGDTLMFSGVNIKGLKVLVCEEDLQKDLLFVKLETVATQLSEVTVINYNHINAVSLGIVSADQKKYTPAERKLKSASKGFLTVDPILNMFSGRTAELKRNVETEKKEFWLTKIEELFEDVILVEKLKVPSEYIKGFQYFLVENKRFVQLLEGKNKTVLHFVLAELAVKYKSSIAYE
ncbi:hypothetical protein ACI6PS_11690 [Flavobacterium sp. PLA-1-15]|uniref:hypothetical protein n=1 Tax=Flavobacterium sp. PLA-1-15 TaxID=3380533 RepID=UPI003B77217A